MYTKREKKDVGYKKRRRVPNTFQISSGESVLKYKENPNDVIVTDRRHLRDRERDEGRLCYSNMKTSPRWGGSIGWLTSTLTPVLRFRDPQVESPTTPLRIS